MGLSRKNSSANASALAGPRQGSASQLNSLAAKVSSNGAITPTVSPQEPKTPSTNTSVPCSPSGSLSSGADGKEYKDSANVRSNGVAGPQPSLDKASAASIKEKPKEEKNPMARLTRMFSQGSREKEKEREKQRERERKQHGGENPSVAPPSGPASPLPRHAEGKEGENSSDTDNTTSRASSVTGDQPKSRNGLVQYRNNGDAAQHFVRFEIFENGVDHVHHLRAARRQEKLSTMLQSWLGGGQKKKEEVAAGAAEHTKDQLSLLHSWVDQWKTEKIAHIKKDASGNATGTLVEKYGRCHEVIGRGAFGVVRISHKADPKDSSIEQLFAVKEFRRRPQETQKKYTKRLTSEFCISSTLHHPNVIQTLDLLEDAKGDYCEVMEYCAGGDLFTLILSAGKLELLEADCYFKQLMSGVQYMHEMGVAHRDLKPENLLLTQDGCLKITDFGNGECFRMAWEKEAHLTAGLCGSAPYIAPEEYTDKEFDPRAVDVWATGVIYMAMRTGRHLWRTAKRDEDEFYERYVEGRRDEAGYEPIEALSRVTCAPDKKSSMINDQCRYVIYSILDPNPSRRLTAKQVLNSQWGMQIKVCKAGKGSI